MKVVCFLLSLLWGRGVGITSNDKCEWDVRLCETSDVHDHHSTCLSHSLLASLSEGMELQEFIANMDAQTDEPVATEDGAVTYNGFPYYLRVDIHCASEGHTRQANLEAYHLELWPNVVVTFQEPVHATHFKPHRLEVILTPAPLLENVPCESEICQMAWYTPMPILNGSVVYRIKVVSNGIGPDVLDKRLTVNVNGFVRMETEGTEAMSLGTEIPVTDTIHGSTSVPLWSVVSHAPVLILPVALGYNTVLMTATEFQHTKLIEVAIESCLTCSSGCSEDESSSRDLEAISTESSLFLLHKQQLHQFVGNYSILSLKVPPSDSWRCVLPSVCVSAIVPVFLPHWGREYFYVLERRTLHRAEIYEGDVSFTELVDSNRLSVCQFLSGEACKVVWATQAQLYNPIDVILVKLQLERTQPSYHLILLLDREFKRAEVFPTFIPKDSGHFSFPWMGEHTDVSLVIKGVVFNSITNTLYIWGNSLICSLNTGSSYLFFSGFPVDQTIEYFVLSYHGEFAFVTEIEELWWGQEGVDQVLRLPPSVFSGSLLTVFYDSHHLLQAVVHRSEANGTGRIEKRHVPLAEIISYNALSLVEAQPRPDGSSLDSTCRPFEVHLEGLPRPRPYSRMQQYLVRSLVNGTYGLHSSTSLVAYQALLYHLLQLHSQYIREIGDPFVDPVARWHMDQVKYQAYALTSSGFSLEVEGDTLAEGSCEVEGDTLAEGSCESVLPDRLYLNRLSSFSLSVRVTCGNAPHLSAKENRELCDTDDMFLSATVANHHYLSVSVTSTKLFSYRSIIYKVTVMDRDQYPGQAPAGERMLSSSLLLRVVNTKTLCSPANRDSLKGLYRAAIYMGCPPGKRLVFDIGTTLRVRDRKCARLNKCKMECLELDTSIPCFHYKQGFRPYFFIQDLVSGEKGQYDGNYTFKVVGGGVASEHLVMYSEEEVLKYNLLNYSSERALIWEMDESPFNFTEDGHIIMQGNRNKIRWANQQNSPCGDLLPQNSYSPNFYFVIEISNKGVDQSTYCGHTTRITILILGFPISRRKARSYMLGATVTMVVITLMAWLFTSCHSSRH